MIRTRFFGDSAPRALAVLGVVALAGCSSEMNFSPTAPAPQAPRPYSSPGALRTLSIIGSLTPQQGSCVEATILYDGQELGGARAVCGETSGCARLDLAGVVRTASGHHTISFQVLRQSPEAVEYVAEATVRMSRDNLSSVVTLGLEPARQTLRAGETVTFDVDFRDSLS